MQSMTRRGVWMSAWLCALVAVAPVPAAAQEGRQMVRIGTVELKPGGRYDFEEANRMASAASKKNGMPWREYWRATLFGDVGRVVTVMPVSSMAMFDGESAIAKMSSADRARYTTLMSNSVASARYELSELLPDISLQSGRQAPAKFARVTLVHVIPGKQREFEDAVKTVLLPAMKKAGVKDYWVLRTLLGGPVTGYTTVLLFEKWAELDSLVSMEKLLDPEALKQYMSKVSATVSHAENAVFEMDPAIGYR